ncbi:MAG: deoxynucleoside kinase, partial [Bacteroidota bacterium]
MKWGIFILYIKDFSVNEHKPLSIIVEGNIGAGKSTFLKMIDTYLDTQIVYEPHEQWQNV